ncbi:MAG: hypothetical protein ACKV2U_04780 [Bryobacteraceae bacterium]
MTSSLEAELDFAVAELEQELEGASQPSTCNRALMEQLVNQCVGNARSCVIRAHGELTQGLVKCRLNPWCNAREMWKYYRALGACRDAIMPCDAAAKRRAGCG